MLQEKLLSDLINYRKHGLSYALEQISKDYTCSKCHTKYQNMKDAKNCC